MTTIRIPSVRPELGVRASKGSPVVIATDGDPQSDAALAAGRLFAASPEAMQVVTVIAPSPAVGEAVVGPEITYDVRRLTRRKVVEQMYRVWNQPEDVRIVDGDPAEEIVRMAHAAAATMIVCGLGAHRAVDRLPGGETALRLVRHADVPVFAAAAGSLSAPQRIVIACDFSETSLRAARLSLELAAPDATVFLVHVAPREGTRFNHPAWIDLYLREAQDALAATAKQLQAAADTIVQPALLQGDAAAETLAFAETARADLIATGSHGHGFMTRLLVGSVATKILRGSSCSVLTVPARAVMNPDRETVSWQR